MRLEPVRGERVDAITTFKIGLVTAMGAALLLVLAEPTLRHLFALELPPWPDLTFGAAVADAAIALLDLGWRISGWQHRRRRARSRCERAD